ncbi:MAG: hypothetical protein KJ964_06620 [Verrucomicrobia bacterium]|nr:hypothetical protein [Verrucomicrobiota bacterium]MBU1856379.1 hypothetical protein [Verrucomicrobiota bacterium]
MSLTLIVTALVFAVGIGLFGFWRYLPRNASTLGLALLRLLTIALLGWCLLLPSLKQVMTEIRKPRFIVALDQSASMSMTPTTTMKARWAAAQEILKLPWTETLAGSCGLDYVAFASDLSPRQSLAELQALNPDGKSTLLSQSLTKLIERYRGQPVAGLLLLSDGLDTREVNDEWAVEHRPYPIYTVRLEPPNIWKVEPDLRVDTLDTPRRVVVGWDTEIKANVYGQGTRGRTVDAELYACPGPDGENNKLIDTAPVDIPDEGGRRELTFRLTHPVTGNFTYTLRLPPIEGETRTNDNTYAVTVQVIDSKNRLLYIEGVPRWESKYLVRVLKGLKDITPVCFVRGPGGRFLSYGASGAASPDLSEQQLLNFKIVLLGDLDATELSNERAEALIKFVENGGSLMILGGPKAWGAQGLMAGPLSKILPIKAAEQLTLQENQFALALTSEGRAHPIFTTEDAAAWSKIPPVLSIFTGGTLSPGATELVIAETPNGRQPVLVIQKYGQGRVAAILTDSLWRWQLAPGKINYYQRLWNPMLAWLSPTETDVNAYQLDLAADADQVYPGETIDLKARLTMPPSVVPKDVVVTCEVQEPDDRNIPFRMTKQDVTTTTGKKYPGYSVSLTPQKPGLHNAVASCEISGQKIVSAPFSFFVQPFTPETVPRAANIGVLMTIADASKGRFCEPEEVNKVLSEITIPANEEERVSYLSLWNNIPVLTCLIGLLGLEWILRKLRNMA